MLEIKLRKKTKTTLSKVILFGAFFIITTVILFPLFSLILSSFRPGRDLMRFGITFASIQPTGLMFDNYPPLFFTGESNYLFWLQNSVLLVLFQTVISIFFSSLVGYGLAIYKFKGKKLLFAIVLVMMITPIQILILPLYKIMISLKIMNTYLAIILPFIISPFAVFFFRQYSLGLPRALLDAARIDGVSEIGIYFRIMTPLLKPAFGAMAILESLRSWNSYLWPLIVLRTSKMFTLPIGLNALITPYGNNYDLLISGSVVATVPIIVIFIIFQKYFISGLSVGSVKG